MTRVDPRWGNVLRLTHVFLSPTALAGWPPRNRELYPSPGMSAESSSSGAVLLG
jgi:hypothetical protein